MVKETAKIFQKWGKYGNLTRTIESDKKVKMEGWKHFLKPGKISGIKINHPNETYKEWDLN